jgi:hypothetical protein
MPISCLVLRDLPERVCALVRAKGNRWVDAGGAAGGDVAGEQSDGGEKQRDGDEGCRITADGELSVHELR